MIVVVASHNEGKLREFRQLFPKDIDLVSAAALGVRLPEESGATYLENATLKALVAATTGFPSIGDDSGLEVDALNGNPGVRSARFAGEGASDRQNIARLIDCLKDVPSHLRGARFRSVVVVATPAGQLLSSEGVVDGVILLAPRGANGFGYDPVFEFADAASPELVGKTAAEVEPEKKNLVSHRARAMHGLMCRLLECGLFGSLAGSIETSGERF